MKLPKDGRTLFIAMMQCALDMKKMGKSKKDFTTFAEEIWISMEMNDPDKLRQSLLDAMMSDLGDYLERKHDH